MHACSWVSLIGFAVACAIACGSDDEEPAGGDPNETPTPPAPGACKRICCADTDCASGESCNAFESGAGPLGACSGTGSGQWGGTAMPAGCWTLGTPDCDPFTNATCTEDDVCDYRPSIDRDFESTVSCAGGDRSRKLGESCDDNLGPWCDVGMHCVPD